AQIGVFGMPLDVRVNECTLGDQLAAIAPDVIEGGPGELRAVALAFVLRGHLGVSEGADAVAILVVQHAADLSGVAQFVAALRRVLDDRDLTHCVAPCMEGISIWKAGSKRAFSTMPPGA